MSHLLVLVANQSQARLFEADGLQGPLVEKVDFANRVARDRGQDLVTDEPGYSMGSRGIQPHPMEHENAAHRRAMETFAKDIVAELDRMLYNSQRQLYVLASPRFLGVLRNKFNDNVNGHLLGGAAKDFTDIAPIEILRHLQDHLTVKL